MANFPDINPKYAAMLLSRKIACEKWREDKKVRRIVSTKTIYRIGGTAPLVPPYIFILCIAVFMIAGMGQH